MKGLVKLAQYCFTNRFRKNDYSSNLSLLAEWYYWDLFWWAHFLVGRVISDWWGWFLSVHCFLLLDFPVMEIFEGLLKGYYCYRSWWFDYLYNDRSLLDFKAIFCLNSMALRPVRHLRWSIFILFEQNYSELAFRHVNL